MVPSVGKAQKVKQVTNEELLAALDQKFNQIDKRFDKIQNMLDDIDERLGSVEDNSEITRDGVNAILEWADIIGRINNHPIAK